jgi:hypothetical protein
VPNLVNIADGVITSLILILNFFHGVASCVVTDVTLQTRQKRAKRGGSSQLLTLADCESHHFTIQISCFNINYLFKNWVSADA